MIVLLIGMPVRLLRFAPDGLGTGPARCLSSSSSHCTRICRFHFGRETSSKLGATAPPRCPLQVPRPCWARVSPAWEGNGGLVEYGLARVF